MSTPTWPWPFPIHNGKPIKRPKPVPFNPNDAPEAPFVHGICAGGVPCSH